MLKTVSLAVIALLTVAIASEDSEFKRFHTVETYEVQPGVLMQPTYSSGGEVCSVAIEKRHYSSHVIDVDAEMSHEQIWQIFDALTPKQDRGRSTFNLGDVGELTTVDGGAATTTAEYENVSLQMTGKAAENGSPKNRKYVVAIIHWKKRGPCN